MAVEEKVLVVERKVVEDVGRFHGLMFDVEQYLREIFVQGVPCFMNRGEVEENPDYKQLIPYVIMSYEGKYLNYVRGRRAGEKRLVGLRSIGIGGHINPVDDEVPLFDTDFREMYAAAVEREVAEEVNVEAGHSDRIAALLNDDSNRVGSVHLGIVHYWTLDSDEVSRREQMITQMDFKSIEELEEVRESMETWSMLCLGGLREMARRAESGVWSHQEKTE
jgi:predicted NUDIX family phosphoesterase